MGLSDKTVRSYLDILTGTFMVRQLQPWHESLGKRQVKAPKIYLQDSGLLHSLLDINDRRTLLAHPRVGASFEGFAIEQILRAVSPSQAFFWGTYGGSELDLLLLVGGRKHGVEIKLSEVPTPTRSMHTAISDLSLDHLWVIYPGAHAYPVDDRISVSPIREVAALPEALRSRPSFRPSRPRRVT
jgi:hypothetical protein